MWTVLAFGSLFGIALGLTVRLPVFIAVAAIAALGVLAARDAVDAVLSGVALQLGYVIGLVSRAIVARVLRREDT